MARYCLLGVFALVGILIGALIAVLVLVLVVILIAVLILVLVIHVSFLQILLTDVPQYQFTQFFRIYPWR